jgi:RES domain-containing protein
MARQFHGNFSGEKIAVELAHFSAASRDLGNWRPWIQEKRSAALALPSAISPADTNFLLNPEHPDFKRIRIHSPIDFDFDPRLLGR